MYRAIKEIGEFKIGDKIPDDKALLWLKMYATPHVEKCDSKDEAKLKKEAEEKAKLEAENEAKEAEEKAKLESSKGANLLDDYLGRNENVVLDNILKDNLSLEQLSGLFKIEKSDKKRGKVLKAIQKKANK